MNKKEYEAKRAQLLAEMKAAIEATVSGAGYCGGKPGRPERHSAAGSPAGTGSVKFCRRSGRCGTEGG